MTGRRDADRSTTRRLLIFAAASILLHLLFSTALLMAPGPLNFARKTPDTNAPLPSIEFVMVQQKGFGKPTAPSAPARPSPPTTPPAPQAAKPPSAPEPLPEDQHSEPMPQPPAAPAPPQKTEVTATPAAPPAAAPAPPQKTEVTATPAAPPAAAPAPKAERAPEVHLGGTDSLSSLIATGTQMIPVSVDTKFRNREPVYPAEAARFGQHGLVVVQAHVAPDGHTEAADIQKSSGFPLLDKAAQDAVITWHFHPAIESGVPVQSKISVGIDFALH